MPTIYATLAPLAVEVHSMNYTHMASNISLCKAWPPRNVGATLVVARGKAMQGLTPSKCRGDRCGRPGKGCVVGSIDRCPASTSSQYHLNCHRRRGSDVTILVRCNSNHGCRRIFTKPKNIHNPVKISVSLRASHSRATLIVERVHIVPHHKFNVYSPFTCRNTDIHSRVVGYA